MSDQLFINSNPLTFEVNEKAALKLRKKYAKIIKKKGLEPGSKTVIDHFYDEDVKKNTVLIQGLGVSVRGSVQYILNELNYDKKFAKYKIYVRTKDHTDETVNEYIKQNNWSRTSTVPKGYYKKLESCKYIFTESYVPYQWIKKKDQVFIDIWHGTPLKKLGVIKNGNKAHMQSKQQKNFLCTDYFLYPNDFTKDVMINSYNVATLMQGKELMLGYPRTAGLLKVSKERTAEIRNILGPNGEKVYAYMPTFRGYLDDEETIKREKEFLSFLDEKLTDDQILYVNLHHHISQGLDCSEFKHIHTFPPLIDSYELLTATDALISDYSSVFFDYLVLGKQIILYIEDYDTYSSFQGLNMDIRELPFDMAKSKDDVINMLNNGKGYDDTEIRQKLCAYDSADNPAKLCQLFADDEEGLVLDEHPHDSRKKVIFYSECCREGAETELLHSFSTQVDSDKTDYWVGCDSNKTKKHISGAYPMLLEVQNISSEDDIRLSTIGAPIKELYLSGKIDFGTAIKYLIHEYGLISIQEYGYTVFDTMVIYDTPNPEMILSLALSSAKNKVLFINKDILSKIENGNTFLKDSIAYAADYCSVVAVTDKADKETAEKLLSKTWKNKVSVIESVEDMNGLLAL
ncbi:CDP-Glycerol:Poly(glycerophosphate) glycerophosphotransferase [Lachnospiraceae bacterium]|nr:CDP-Glycerol:Poly(glycerophosphate) glycerophosphotransferase [Lachnospiraceae bacterium]